MSPGVAEPARITPAQVDLAMARMRVQAVDDRFTREGISDEALVAYREALEDLSRALRRCIATEPEPA